MTKRNNRRGNNQGKPFTVTELKAYKPEKSTYRITEGNCLYFEVRTNGSTFWRHRYYANKKQNTVPLGKFPQISLQEARRRNLEILEMRAQGIDPLEHQRAMEVQEKASIETFEKIARDYLEKAASSMKEKSHKDIVSRLERNVFGYIGSRPIGDITPQELLKVVKRIEERGATETARRMLQKCGQIFRYAVANGMAERDVSQDLKGAIIPKGKKHHASIQDAKEVSGLMRAIHTYEGQAVTRYALQLVAITFVRSGELRKAEWSEIDFETKEWRIPARRMKMSTIHIVPLSDQAISILKEVQMLTGSSKYVFHSIRSRSRAMSDNTINAALRRMGYTKEEMTCHGFRSMASTLLNEHGWNRDAIERQLAHSERNRVRAAYNYAEYLPERKKMMQWYADYLDSLREGAKVIPFHRAS